MSDITAKEIQQMKELGSRLIAKLSKQELCTLSLAYDCGEFDHTMDKTINPQVAKDFPELFVDPFQDENGIKSIPAK